MNPINPAELRASMGERKESGWLQRIALYFVVICILIALVAVL